jgi:hypothetical protein
MAPPLCGTDQHIDLLADQRLNVDLTVSSLFAD